VLTPGISDNGLGVVQLAVMAQEVGSGSPESGRLQERIPADTIELCDSSEHACPGHITNGHTGMYALRLTGRGHHDQSADECDRMPDRLVNAAYLRSFMDSPHRLACAQAGSPAARTGLPSWGLRLSPEIIKR
jgi:hypothetical protein